ncbi:hypothetical protein NCCP2222_35060 [Sporosarcina sp. NCCP-2222]|uniref:hypothetical protein n=1 Tax=Sporosarcina sp. NCCP-2222 TaxID=2935073 RepID=UPI002082C4E3|nr:hypothetical protein [Sporosarcina sp. NCCP-2222]GKV57559.1 hypothetical protein NCCP2222_35060 [Sporosarcina sp. NCCP-2222]
MNTTVKAFIPILLSLIILSACNTYSYEYKFSGENDHWEAEIFFKGTEDQYSRGDANYDFTVTYKGLSQELASTDEITYSFETESENFSATKKFSNPPTDVSFTSKGNSSGTVSADEQITVNVKWNGIEESFELENISK